MDRNISTQYGLRVSLLILLVLWLTACGGQKAVEDTPGQSLPTARIQLSSSRGLAPMDVSFSAAQSTAALGVAQFDWDFGDTTTGSGEMVSHTFTEPGQYSVNLMVTDNQGQVSSDTVWVTVLNQASSFSLYGTVTAMPYMAIDSDTNDPNAQGVNNNGDAEDNVQTLSSPVVLNGFVTETPTGTEGDAFELTNDLVDVFEVTLAEGDYVSLRILESNADLDLMLLRAQDLSLVASSITDQAIESIRVPSNDRYRVVVEAASGSSTYFLKLGKDSLTSGLSAQGQSAEFEPFETVVKFKEETSKEPLLAQHGQVHLSHRSLKRECLARINPLNPQTRAHLKLDSPSHFDTYLASRNTRAMNKVQTLRALKAVRKQKDVHFAELNYRVTPKFRPNDTLFRYQWNLTALNLPQAWDVTIGSGDLLVAVVDSGLFDHPDLIDRTVEGFDFISSIEDSNDGDGIDADPSDPGDNEDITQSSWHGTHVVGALAANINNRTGIAGVAAGVKVMPLRVLGPSGGSVYDVLQAVRYAAGLENDSGKVPSQTADIINLSLGGAGFSQFSQDLYQQVREQGIFVVAASGNENTDELMYPAAYDGVISVGAYDYQGQRAPYSNYNSQVDVAAPGGDLATDINRDGWGDGVLSLTVTGDERLLLGGYAFYQGTSVAAPQVSGIIALMLTIHPELTPEDFDSLLVNGDITYDIGAKGKDDAFGYGAIDALLAVQAAQALANGASTAALLVNPSDMAFDANVFEKVITLSKVGSGSLGVVSATFSENWVDAVPLEVDEMGFGEYQVVVDRRGLSQGSYNAEIIFQTTTGSELSVNVNMRVGEVVETGNAGHIYILLIDSETDVVVATLASDGLDGEYPYHFNDVPLGAYYLMAGTDINNDGQLCVPGEICGYYPSYNQKSLINLNSDKQDMNFVTGLFFDTPSENTLQALVDLASLP